MARKLLGTARLSQRQRIWKADNMKTPIRFALIASLAFGANVASAIPLQVNVNTLSAGGSAGSWELTGLTAEDGSWFHLFIDSDSWNLDILPGAYNFNIDGGSLGLLGKVAWDLRLDGEKIYSDSASGFFIFHFDEDHRFTAERVSVPEPGALTLLGVGLALLGLGARRKRRPNVV
jgi:hypothetical protein